MLGSFVKLSMKLPRGTELKPSHFHTRLQNLGKICQLQAVLPFGWSTRTVIIGVWQYSDQMGNYVGVMMVTCEENDPSLETFYVASYLYFNLFNIIKK